MLGPAVALEMHGQTEGIWAECKPENGCASSTLKPIAPPPLVAKYVIAGARAAATRLVDRASQEAFGIAEPWSWVALDYLRHTGETSVLSRSFTSHGLRAEPVTGALDASRRVASAVDSRPPRVAQ